MIVQISTKIYLAFNIIKLNNENMRTFLKHIP